jgi:MFS family permease
MALLAALLGWMFDGFEMGIFPLVARPALIDVLDLSEDAAKAAGSPKVEDQEAVREKEQAQEKVDGEVNFWMGIVTAAFLVGAAVGGWAFGWLGDRLGRVRAMVFSVLTYALFTGLCGLAQDAGQLAGLRFIAALGMGGEWSLGVALVMESWRPQARPVLAGLIGAASNVGFLLTGLLGMGLGSLGLQFTDGGWRWVLGICAFPALLTFFIRMFVPESEKWQAAVKTAPQARFAEIFVPHLRRRTIVAAIIGGVALLGTWGTVQWIPVWVKGMTGNQAQVNLAVIASALGAILGSYLGAVLGSRISRRWAYFTLCVASLLICAYLFRFFARATMVDWHFYGVVAATGALTASFYGWLPLYLPELFPTRLRATGQGFCYNFGRIIAAAGALSTGLMVKNIFGGSFAKAGATMSLIYGIGLLVIWLAPETRAKPLPE